MSGQTSGNSLFWQSVGAFIFGILLIIAAVFFVNGNQLYNPVEIKGLVMFLGLFLTGTGLLLGIVALFFGQVMPPEDKDKK